MFRFVNRIYRGSCDTSIGRKNGGEIFTPLILRLLNSLETFQCVHFSSFRSPRWSRSIEDPRRRRTLDPRAEHRKSDRP